MVPQCPYAGYESNRESRPDRITETLHESAPSPVRTHPCPPPPGPRPIRRHHARCDHRQRVDLPCRVPLGGVGASARHVALARGRSPLRPRREGLAHARGAACRRGLRLHQSRRRAGVRAFRVPPFDELPVGGGVRSLRGNRRRSGKDARTRAFHRQVRAGALGRVAPGQRQGTGGHRSAAPVLA